VGAALAASAGFGWIDCAGQGEQKPPPGQSGDDGGESPDATLAHAADGAVLGPDGGAVNPDGGTEAEPNLCPADGVGIPIFAAACDAGAPSVDWSPIRRISRVEYDNMVRDLLKDQTQPAAQFVAETPLTSDGINFWTNTCTGVGAGDITVPQQYMHAAETLAANATSDPNTFNNILNQFGLNTPCSAMPRGDACAQGFIHAFGSQAFRGQIDAAEESSLFSAVYSPIAAQFDFPTGIQALITAFLTSPRFLFVVEFGDTTAAGRVVPLGQTEIAARLALFLWRSVPDTVLLDAAAAGQLATPAQIEAQATRMLAVVGPNGGGLLAQGALDDFATQWMELENAHALTKDPQYTTWNNVSALSAELVGETLATFHATVLGTNGSGGGTLTDLLTSTSSYVNSDVKNFYAGQPVTSSGCTTTDTSGSSPCFTQQVVDSPTSPRRGILTDAIVLAAQSHTSFPSPTLRGKLVRQQILCDPVPPPPANVNTSPPANVPPGATIKQQYAAHRDVDAGGCPSCHNLMDPIGDTFGVYDATGTYQTTEADGLTDGGPFAPIDPSGQVNAFFPGELATTATGPVDLITQLAAARQVQECFALQEFRYALSRIETPADSCSVQSAYQAFAAGQLNVKALLLAIVQSDAFRYRTVETPGSCQ
jgi:hypothetical protein